MQNPLSSFDKPVLIFDRSGLLGGLISTRIIQEYFCVFASESKPKSSPRVYYVPLGRRAPVIPKAIYESIFLIYNKDKTLLDLLPLFAEKAINDKSHIYFFLRVKDANRDLISKVLETSTRITIVLTGDVFENYENFANKASDLIRWARSGRLVVDNALSPIYPIALEDLLNTAVKLIKLQGIKGHRILYFLPPFAVTKLSFARELCKKEPLLKLDIQDSKINHQGLYTPAPYLSAFGPKYDYTLKLPRVEVAPAAVGRTSIKRRKVKLKMPRVNYLYTAVIVVLMLIITSPLFSAFMGARFLVQARSRIMSGDIQRARTSASAAKLFFAFAEKSLVGVRVFSYAGLGSQVELVASRVKIGELVSEIVVLGIDGFLDFQHMLQKESRSPRSDLASGVHNIKQAVLKASVIRAEGSLPSEYRESIAKFDQLTNLVNGLVDSLPEILGIQNEKSYLVLFQNNMELRPAGGFIGSYGILKINKGRIEEFPIYDVYDADGQLTQHIEPPFQLRKYLGSVHWYLRDSNFDIDFPRSAANAAYFYKLETKKDVDGVIAVDTQVLKKLLNVIGPLKIPDYGETLTAENFIMLTQAHSQDNFFPGSNQKENFLKTVASSIFNKLVEGKGLRIDLIAGVIAESISEKHLLFAHPSKDIQQVLAINNASSSLKDLREDGQGIFNDFLGVNEANLGENKTNYYLERSISQLVMLEQDGRMLIEARVKYLNKSKITDKYGGDYKSYLRFVLPKNAEIKTLSFDGVEQEIIPAIVDPAVFLSPRFTPSKGLEVERVDYEGKTVYGFLNTVPMGKEKNITITYEIATRITPELAKSKYSLKVYKQPGTIADSYSFTIMLPDNLKALSVSDGVRITSTGATYLTNLVKDRVVEIGISKK